MKKMPKSIEKVHVIDYYDGYVMSVTLLYTTVSIELVSIIRVILLFWFFQNWYSKIRSIRSKKLKKMFCNIYFNFFFKNAKIIWFYKKFSSMKNSTPYIYPSFIRGNYWVSKTSLKWIDKFGHENSMLSIRTKQKEKSHRLNELLHCFIHSHDHRQTIKKKSKKKQIRKNKKWEERKRDVAWKPIVAKQRQTGENDA